MRFLKTNFSKEIYICFFSLFLGTLFALCFEPFTIPFFSLLIIGLFFITNDLIFRFVSKIKKIFFFHGFFFGFGFFLSSMYWISNSILELDQNLKYLIPIPLILLPLVLSLFIGLMQLINAYLWGDSNSRIFFFTSTWTIFELLRSSLFTGLPWNLIGYSWSWSLSYSQVVSVFGIYGLGMITVFCSTCIFSLFFNRKNIIYFFISITLLITIYLFGYFRINSHQNLYLDYEIRIVHTHFDQNKKWLKESIDQTASFGSADTITIFPESSLGMESNRPENWIFGYIRKDEDKYFNSLGHMGYIYDKKILVPFGEYFPFYDFFNNFFPNNRFVQNSLTKGSDDQEFHPNLTPLICYEAIFPSFVRSGVSDKTNLLVNISNDAWFGNYSGPRQHFVHSYFRSLELGIPMLRSSNKGFSGLISPIGEIISEINTKEITYKDVKIPKKLDTTFYRKYGNLLTYFLIVFFFIIGYAVRKNNIRNHE